MQNQRIRYLSIPAFTARGTAVLLAAFLELCRGVLLLLLDSPVPAVPSAVWMKAFVIGAAGNRAGRTVQVEVVVGTAAAFFMWDLSSERKARA